LLGLFSFSQLAAQITHGRWTEKFQKEFIKGCLSELEKSGATGDKQASLEYCRCAMNQMMVRFSEKEAENISAATTVEVITPCLKFLTSGKMSWNSTIESSFLDNCVRSAMQSAEVGTEKATNYCRCTIDLLKGKYPNFSEILNMPYKQMMEEVQPCLDKLMEKTD
jgi:hypothetical protein